VRKEQRKDDALGKRRIALVTALAVAATLGTGWGLVGTGWGASPATRVAHSAQSFTLGLSMPFLNSDFQVVMQKQFTAAAKKQGIKLLPPTNANMDSGKQITDIRNLISAGAQALIVVANDSKAIIPALSYAKQKHVPVVSVDIGPDGGNVAMIVRADNVGMGWIACRAMAKAIGGTGKVLSLQGAFTSINGRDRTKGFHDCMKQNYPNIQLIERPTDWDPAKQVAAIQTVFTSDPDLKGIYSQADWCLSATLNQIKKSGHGAKVGQPGHVYTISIDATPLALQKIKQGYLDAGISQPLDLYVKYGLQYLKQAMAGKVFKPGKSRHSTTIVRFNGNPMDLMPATLVTRKNVNDSKLWGNQVS
jgi:ABC-type sugar transport system substrate-binding protein